MSYMTQQFPWLLWTLLGNFILPLWGHKPEVNLKKIKQKNMKLVAGNVFYSCKGQPYLALLLPFQKKSNTFFKKKLSTTTFFILNSKIYSRKGIATKLEQNQSPINQNLNFSSRMTLPVLDLIQTVKIVPHCFYHNIN